VAATLAEAAPPSLFYSLLPLNHSQGTCMKRAYATVASEVSGKINKRADNVSLVNDDWKPGSTSNSDKDKTKSLQSFNHPTNVGDRS
jgi:hypothetical protein